MKSCAAIIVPVLYLNFYDLISKFWPLFIVIMTEYGQKIIITKSGFYVYFFNWQKWDPNTIILWTYYFYCLVFELDILTISVFIIRIFHTDFCWAFVVFLWKWASTSSPWEVSWFISSRWENLMCLRCSQFDLCLH